MHERVDKLGAADSSSVKFGQVPSVRLKLDGGFGHEPVNPRKLELISFNKISNLLRYLYEKPPYNNRKCGRIDEVMRNNGEQGTNL